MAMAASNSYIPRREARRLGLGHYFTGVACKNGHVSERFTKSKKCLECHRLARAALRKSDPARIKAQKAASYLRHRNEVIAQASDYARANRHKVYLRRKKHRQENKERLAEEMKA